jgi:hypothetical protein
MSGESPSEVRPDQVDIYIAIGRDATVSPGVRQALDQLAQALEQSEGSPISPELICQTVVIGQCKVFMSCSGVTL